MKNEYQILLFYKYVGIKDPEVIRDWIFRFGKARGFTGRCIIAPEGLNMTLEGKTEDTEAFITELEKDERFRDIHFKKSEGNGHAFPKWSVKVRSEIVTLGLGVCDIDPNKMTGKRLSVDELHEWFKQNKEFYVVDMRNVYEHSVGRFEDSICPPLENFRDLPKVIKQLQHLKNKTVLTVCTGGIRCEKASGYLISQGFNDVYQLDGGIVTYMEKYPNEHFKGKLYVFDDRTVMGFYTDDPKHEIVGRCKVCDKPEERFVDCLTVWCGKHFILCETCEKQFTKNGKVTCPKGCELRRPHKIKSPLIRFFRGIFK